MSDPLCDVDGCGRPIPDQGYVCVRHGELLAQDLGDVPGLAAELVTTWARLARTGDGGTAGRRAVEPLPFNWAASHDAATLANTLGSWAGHIAEERGVPLPVAADDPQAVATAAARWLLAGRHVQWLRHRPEAAEAFDELTHAIDAARWAIDTKAPRWYAGPCGYQDAGAAVVEAVFGLPTGCATDLYARPGAQRIVCPTCGTGHDAAARRQELLAAADDTWAHAELIGRAATALGKAITPAMVRGYARYGRVDVRYVDAAGRPLYRVGDVLAVFDRAAAEQAAKRRTSGAA